MSDNSEYVLKFLVLGLGSGASHAIEQMARQITNQTNQVDFAIAHTDIHQLERFDVPCKLQLGSKTGLGHTSLEAVRQLTEQSESAICKLLDGYDVVFLVAGLGGHTGTGSAPIVARIAKEMESCHVVSVVTMPFVFEGQKRQQVAQDGIKALSKKADCVISIDNKPIEPYSILSEDLLQRSNDAVCHAVQNIISSFNTTNLTVLNLSDAYTALTGSGRIGFGRASGEERATIAAQFARYSPLLNGVNFEHVQNFFVSITAADFATIEELLEVADIINNIIDLGNGNIFYDIGADKNLGDEMIVTVMVTSPFDDTP